MAGWVLIDPHPLHKSYMLVRRVFLSIAFSMIAGITGAQTLPFTHYTTESERNPLPSAEVHSVLQDSQGFFWFAVYSSGLVRYDGVSFTLFDQTYGLANLSLWDMVEDRYGYLWATTSAGVVVTEAPIHSYTYTTDIRFSNRIGDTVLFTGHVGHNRILADHEGRVWVGTENFGIIRYGRTGGDEVVTDTISTTLQSGTTQRSVRAMVQRSDNSVWVSLVGGGLIRVQDRAVLPISAAQGTSNVNVLQEDSFGTLWGGEQSGRVWRLAETNQGFHLEYLSGLNINANVVDMSIDPFGMIRVASEGSGLRIIDPVAFRPAGSITRENGLLSDIVFGSVHDREGNTWIVQSGGISKLRYNYRAFLNLSAQSVTGTMPVLPSASINTVVRIHDSLEFPCHILAGSSEGGIACIDQQFASAYIQTHEGLTGNWVNGIAIDETGRIWAGTSRGLNSIAFDRHVVPATAAHTGLIRIFDRPAYISRFRSHSVLAADHVVLKPDADAAPAVQTIWFPAYHQVNVALDGEVITLDQRVGLPLAIFHAAASDPNGYILLGTRDRGVYRSLEPVTVANLRRYQRQVNHGIRFEPWLNTENGLPSDQIEKIGTYDGMIWIGTPAGLYITEPDPGEENWVLTTAHGLPANNTTSFYRSTRTGTIWVGTNQGLAEISADGRHVLRTVTRQDGLIDNEVWFYGSVHVDFQGVVYYGTAKGLAIYDPDLDKINKVPPTVVLTQRAEEYGDGSRNEFTFTYAALSFGNERAVRYQYRLLGYHDEWSLPKPDTRVNFTNLSAVGRSKEYILEVRAINEHGIRSDAALRVPFLVRPPTYLTWWAITLYLLVLIAVIYLLTMYQKERLVKMEREAAYIRETELTAQAALAKSNEAEARAKALQAENDLKESELQKARELEKAYHELKLAQNRLIQVEKMASLGRLSTGIAHEIKNPLNFINNFGDLSTGLVEDLRLAIESSDADEIEYILSSLTHNTVKIVEHGRRADSIVKSMMQHSHGNTGVVEPCQINILVKQYAELALHGRRSHIDGMELTIGYQLDEKAGEISVVKQKIGQVIQNIVENAIDAVYGVFRKAVDGYQPEIHIKTVLSNGAVEISITDNGSGVPLEIRERIFEPFFTTKPTGEGTGLGLSLSYDIITIMHNGNLELDDSHSGGSRFVITLPR